MEKGINYMILQCNKCKFIGESKNFKVDKKKVCHRCPKCNSVNLTEFVKKDK